MKGNSQVSEIEKTQLQSSEWALKLGGHEGIRGAAPGVGARE
jgi:hypothetical protein